MYAKVRGFDGIACNVLGPIKVWDSYQCYCTDPETGDEYLEDTGEGEWVDGDGSRMRVVMVGDDHVFEVDADDITPLEETEDGYPFCGSCGQLGCMHGR